MLEVVHQWWWSGGEVEYNLKLSRVRVCVYVREEV